MKISWKNIENWQSWKTRFFWGGHFEFLSRPFWIFFASSHLRKQPVSMRYNFFLHYGWFFQNLGKEAVRTFMHTTVHFLHDNSDPLICHKVGNSKFNWLYLGLWISYLCFKPECTAATAVAGAISKHTREGRGFHFHRGAEREEASSKSKC